MSKSSSKESDIPLLFHIGSSVERHSSVADSACDTHQNSPGSIPSGDGFFWQHCQKLHYKEVVLIYKVHLPFS